ncbi:TPA: hypothetical protein R1X38_001162 [Campylobacter upsaliensis]|nr:hypothetical protein [Campylobacter upsaliensis]
MKGLNRRFKVTNSKLNKAFTKTKGTDWTLGFCFGGASQLIARGANAIA